MIWVKNTGASKTAYVGGKEVEFETGKWVGPIPTYDRVRVTALFAGQCEVSYYPPARDETAGEPAGDAGGSGDAGVKLEDAEPEKPVPARRRRRARKGG